MDPMKVTLILSVLALAACDQPQPQNPVGDFEWSEGAVQHVVHAEEIEWGSCPPNLPDGCQITVLEGDPQGTGLFTVRFKVSEGFQMPPHTHPKDERVTVLAGTVSVAFGADGSRDSATEFGPGDYYVNARDAIHTVFIDDLTELQITGIGPWEVHFVD